MECPVRYGRGAIRAAIGFLGLEFRQRAWARDMCDGHQTEIYSKTVQLEEITKEGVWVEEWPR